MWVYFQRDTCNKTVELMVSGQTEAQLTFGRSEEQQQRNNSSPSQSETTRHTDWHLWLVIIYSRSVKSSRQSYQWRIDIYFGLKLMSGSVSTLAASSATFHWGRTMPSNIGQLPAWLYILMIPWASTRSRDVTLSLVRPDPVTVTSRTCRSSVVRGSVPFTSLSSIMILLIWISVLGWNEHKNKVNVEKSENLCQGVRLWHKHVDDNVASSAAPWLVLGTS